MKYYRISIIALLLIYFLFKTIPIFRINSRCVEYNDFLALKLNGIVVNKYIDSSQHSYKTIIIKDFVDDHLERLLFDSDTTNAFFKINISDSISKEINNDSLYKIILKKRQLISVINFGCNK